MYISVVAVKLPLHRLRDCMQAAQRGYRHILRRIRLSKLPRQRRLHVDHSPDRCNTRHVAVHRVQHAAPQRRRARVSVYGYLLHAAAADCSPVRQVSECSGRDVYDRIRQSGVHVGCKCQLQWVYCYVGNGEHVLWRCDCTTSMEFSSKFK